MKHSVIEVARLLETRGLLKPERHRADAARIIEHVRSLLGRALPPDLEDFYREGIVGFGSFDAIVPIWNDRAGWRTPDSFITELLHVQAAPLLGDGCGNLFGLDLSSGNATPAVYFFDHEDGFKRPHYAAGSSLGSFLLLLADDDRAHEQNWPAKWQLAIDPDLDKCPRAPAIWDAG